MPAARSASSRPTTTPSAPGQVRVAQKRYAEAATLFEQRYAAAPHAENLFVAAQAMELAGRKADAGEAWARFEKAALAESAQADNANHELIADYLDVAHQPARALEIAQRELARRHDKSTLDLHARALAASR